MIEILEEKPRSIEHISQTKEFIRNIPGEIDKSVNEMRKMEFEYKILDQFNFVLPLDDFKLKWTVLGYPANVYKQIKKTEKVLEEYTHYFKRIHCSDVMTFNDQIESLNVQVSSYSNKFDMSKVIFLFSLEISNLQIFMCI